MDYMVRLNTHDMYYFQFIAVARLKYEENND